MRAIKIDVLKKEVYEVQIKGDCPSLYKQLDCETITGVRISKTEMLYVDDEGLRRRPLLGAFRINGYPQALPGHGVIVGLRGPDEVSSGLHVEAVRANVQFVDISELPAPVFTTYHFEKAKDFKDFLENPSKFRSKCSEN